MSAIRELLLSIKNIFVWWFMVTPWEQAIRVRMGKRTDVLGPGLHLRIPVIDAIYRQQIRLRTVDIGMQTLTTADGHAVTIAGNVQYQIEDLLRLYETLHSPGDTIIDLGASLIAQFVTTRTKAECTPAAVSAYATDGLNLSQYGLNSSQVNITDFAFVPTFRLIQDDRQYRSSGHLDMSPESIETLSLA